MLYIRGHKIIKGYIGNTPISYVGFGKSGLIKIKSENGDSDYPNNLIAKYTTNTSGVLPTFNSGYQYTINETESNGIYTVELFSDDDFTSCRFRNKTELLTVDYLKVTDKATTMANLFEGCTSLTEANTSNFNTSNVTNMAAMFYNCESLTSLDVSNFNTSNVTNMHLMFHGCTNVSVLDTTSWNTSKATIMADMFAYCTNLTSIDASNWNTSNVNNMYGMFNGCTNLTSIDASNWDTSNVTEMTWMFSDCTALTDFEAPKNISTDISVQDSSLLTHDSLMSIINNLITVTSTKTLALGAENLAKLSSEEKAIATNKGWTLA